MPAMLAWLLLALVPTGAVFALGLRASRAGTSERWDDYRDAVTLTRMLVAPTIVVAAPLLVVGMRLRDLPAGMLSAGAIFLFCAAACGFSPDERMSLLQRLKRIAATSESELGSAGYLILVSASGHLSSIHPSATLYLILVLATYVSRYIFRSCGRRDYLWRDLGESELLTRVHEIAERHGARVERFTLGRSKAGGPPCLYAVATEGTRIVMSQDVIANLNKTEVDTIIEHEIGHLADETIWSLDHALYYAGFLLMIVLVFLGERYVAWMQPTHGPMRYAVWLGMFLVPGFVNQWYCRRRERKANRSVGTLTDPLSAISALRKGCALSHRSVSRPWWSRVLSTHPYPDEEISEIAGRAGLSQEQIRARLDIADDEMATGEADRYDLPLLDVDEATAARQLAPRPGKWARAGVVVFAIVLGLGVLVGTLIWADKSGFRLVYFLLGFAASALAAMLPLGFANRVWATRLRKRVSAALTARHSFQAMSTSLLVDIWLPDCADRDQPWQGALVSVADGEFVILGEADNFRLPIHADLSIFRYPHQGLCGKDARMVAIGYRDGGNPRAVYMRILGRPNHGEPRDWKQLENRVKEMLTDAGATLMPRDHLFPDHPGKLTWSARIPVAAALYLLIVGAAVFIAREVTGAGRGEVTAIFLATTICGPGLWAWVTGAHKPDDPKK